MTSGLHHTTGITGDAQANVDFYAGLLGLRLVKRTVNHNDPTTLHLFFGDATGTPGTLLSFFAWPDSARGRRGFGQAAEIGLIVPQESLGDWVHRLLSHNVRFKGPTSHGATSRLLLEDSDGLPIALVAVSDAPAGHPWDGSAVPAAMQIRGLHHAVFWTELPQETGRVLERHLGFGPVGEVDGMLSYQTDAAVGHTVYLRNASGFWPGAAGGGTLHHVAFRTPDPANAGAMLGALRADGLAVTELREHGYFQSIYFREPGGSIIEVATDQPGMALDEDLAHLGERLVLPPDLEVQRQDIESVLPTIHLPGEERRPTRDLHWIHRFQPGTSDLTLLLLHGTGGNEASLLPFGRRLAPEANLLSVRGRSLEEGSPRFFRRFSASRYDQAHLLEEADALAEFVQDAAEWYSLDPRRVISIGYSNGANIALASLVRHPGTYAGAVLLRPVMPFEAPPEVNLHGLPVLVVHGEHDPFLPLAGSIASYLRAMHGDVQEECVQAGHELSAEDRTLAGGWLDQRMRRHAEPQSQG